MCVPLVLWPLGNFRKGHNTHGMAHEIRNSGRRNQRPRNNTFYGRNPFSLWLAGEKLLRSSLAFRSALEYPPDNSKLSPRNMCPRASTNLLIPARISLLLSFFLSLYRDLLIRIQFLFSPSFLVTFSFRNVSFNFFTPKESF